jgi:hypothetical protein
MLRSYLVDYKTVGWSSIGEAKKESGRWGDRPLGRGELRVYGLKLVRVIIASRWA